MHSHSAYQMVGGLSLVLSYEKDKERQREPVMLGLLYAAAVFSVGFLP